MISFVTETFKFIPCDMGIQKETFCRNNVNTFYSAIVTHIFQQISAYIFDINFAKNLAMDT